MNTNSNSLELTGLRKTYGPTVAVRQVDLNLSTPQCRDLQPYRGH